MLSLLRPLHFDKGQKSPPPTQLPSPEEGAAIARAGKATRNVYHEDYPVLKGLGGDETPRLAALNAAVSPRNIFHNEAQNTFQALRRYRDWMAERKAAGVKGHPTYDEALGKVREWRKRAWLKAMSTHEPNIARAIAAINPANVTEQLLSGPKVEDYRKGRLLDPNAHPVDVHIARAMGVDQQDLSKQVGSMATPSDLYKKIGEHAGKVVEVLNKDAKGSPYDKLQKQAAQWGFVRAALNEAEKTPQGYAIKPRKLLESLTHEKVGHGASLASLLFGRDKEGNRSKAYRELEAGGLGRLLTKLEKQYRQYKADVPAPQGPVVADLTQRDIDLLLNFLERLRPDMEQRRAARRKKKLQRKKLGKLRFAAPPQAMPVPAAMPQQMPAAMPAQPAAPQKNPIEEHAEHLLAFSPNVDDLQFEDALARTRSANHKSFKKIVQHINEQVGLKAKLNDAIGDWSDGAENSILQQIDVPVDPQTVDYLASWYGLLANQKAVLAFTPTHNGLDSVYQIELPTTDLGAIRKSLDKAGIPFRTLVPSKKGTKVVLYDEKREMRDKVAAWAGTHNATVRESYGQGRFIGGSTRTAARAAYRKTITAYESAAAKSGGQVRAYKPPVLPHHVRSGSPETPLRQAREGQVVRLSQVDPLHDVSIPRDTYSPKAEVSRILGAFRDALHKTKEAFSNTLTREKSKRRRKKRLFYSGVQSPAGGVVVRGLYYPGGRYIPSANLEKASYDQYQHVERQRAKKFRREDGSVSVEPALQSEGAASCLNS